MGQALQANVEELQQQVKQNQQLPQEQERQEQDPQENHLCNGATQQGASEGALLESISNAGMEMLQKQLQDLQLVLHTKDNEIQHLKESANTAAATQPPGSGEESE